MGSISTNDSLYARCVGSPAFELSLAQQIGSPDRSAVLKHLVLDFLPVESAPLIPNIHVWLDSVVDHLSACDTHYIDATKSTH